MASFTRALKVSLLATSVAFALTGCGEKSAEKAFYDAQSMYQAKEFDTAIIELKHSIQQAPQDASARFLLGKIYLEQQAFDFAEKELERAYELGYPQMEVVPLLATAYQRNGSVVGLERLDRANADLTDAQHVQVGYYQAQALLETNKREEAKILIAELQEYDVVSVFADLVDVLASMQQTDIQKTESLLQATLAENPDSLDVLNLLSAVYLAQGKRDLAAPLIEQILTLSKSDPEKEFVYARLLFEIGQSENAQPRVSKLLEIAPNNPLLHQLQALIHSDLQNFSDAYDSAQTAIRQGLDSTVIRFIAGYSAYKQGQYEDANEYLSSIADQLPKNHPGLKMLAVSQLKTGQSLEANEVLSDLLDFEAQNKTLLTQTGFELFRDGHFLEAKAITDKLADAELGPLDQARLGALKLQFNDIDGVADLKAAVDANPQSVPALETLAKAYITTQQFDEAIALSEQWQASSPENYRPILLEGEAALRLGDVARAEEAFVRAKALEPNVAETHISLINIKMKRQELDEAYAISETALAQFPNNFNAIVTHFALVKMLEKSKDPIAPLETYLATGNASDSEKVIAAQLMLNEGLIEKAQSALSDIEASRSTPRKYWSTKATTLLRAQDFAGLVSHYDQWYATLPSDINGFVGRLVMFDLARDFAGGIRFIQQDELLAKHPMVSVIHTHFTARVGDTRNARILYDALPDTIKESPSMAGVYARILLLENKPVEALPVAEQGYEFKPNSDNFLTYYDALRLNKRTEEAYNLLKSYSQNQPEDAVAKVLLAQKYIQSAPDEAIVHYEAILEKNPKHMVALNNLAYLLREAGQLQEALSYAERALELAPNNVAVLDTVAQIHLALNAPETALKFYETAFEQEVRNREIVLNYVEALLQNDKMRVAKRTIAEYEFVDELSLDRLNTLKTKYNM